MVNVCMECCNSPPKSKEAIIVWWNLLKPYDYIAVEKAFNQWVDANDKPPTPNQIKDLCKPKEEFFKLTKKPDKEAQQEGRRKLQEFIANNLKIKRVPQ